MSFEDDARVDATRAKIQAATRARTYREVGAEVGELVETKQAAYGDSFGRAGQVLRVLYPQGIAPSQLDDALTIVRIVDKLFRIATDKDALGEDPWRDIAGYALLSVARGGGVLRAGLRESGD